MILEGVERLLTFAPHPLSPLLLHAQLGQGAEVFAGQLDDPALAGLAALPANSRDLADAVGHADPARFLHRRAISRSLLARRLGCDAASVEIGHDARGAPQLQSHAAPALFLSLSARKNLFALAFAPHRIGVDLEPVEQTFEPPWNMLGLTDRANLAALADPARHLEFLQIWTLREALLKALGVGFLVNEAACAGINCRKWAAHVVAKPHEIILACVELPVEQ